MRKASSFILVLLLSLAIFHLPIYSQSRETGAIQGRVTTDTGEFLPGTEVQLSSPMLIGGDQFVISGGEGKFRFVALPPGTYSVTGTLVGFTPGKKEDIRLHVATTLTVDLVLNVGLISEEIVVVGRAPLIDIKDSQMATSDLPQVFLENIPTSRVGSDIIDLACPSAVQSTYKGSVAYGAIEWMSTMWTVDGADVSDPGDGGGHQASIDFDAIQEAKISGIGANAEYDGYTGAMLSLVTKSGSNKLHGDVNILYTDGSWNSDNTGGTGLSTPAATSFVDMNTHLGGPLIKDKLWFFAGLSYHYSKRQQLGFPEPYTRHTPSLFSKFTWQANKKNRLMVSFLSSPSWSYNTGGGPRRTIDVTKTEKRFKWQYQANWLSTFSDRTFLEAKYSGWFFWNKRMSGGGDLPGHVDEATGWKTVNSTGWYDQPACFINNVQVAVTHHAADFIGSHDFKIGVEVRTGGENCEAQRPGGKWYLDYDGERFYTYAYEGLNNMLYEAQPRQEQISGFAQDSWSITDRLTVNCGLRFNSWHVKFPSNPGNQYKTTGFAPRIGFSYDLFGDHTTALKAHYGRYYEGLYFVSFYAVPSNNADVVGYKWVDENWVEMWRQEGSLPDGTTPTSFDSDMTHPSLEQFTLGITREVARDFSVEVNYINRVWRDIIGTVNLNATWEVVQKTDPFTGAAYDIYNQTNNPEDNRYMITNPYAGQTNSALIDPTRKYNALQIQLRKRFSNNWSLLASYVYSSLRGTFDNTYNENMAYYTQSYKDPNYQYNADGKATFDPTHVFKMQGMVMLPLGINLGANFSAFSGRNYTRMLRIGGLNQGYINLFTEPRGSRRMPTQVNLDIRLHKILNFGDRGSGLGLTLDVFNVLNAGIGTEYFTRAGEMFEEIDGIMNPRNLRVGVKFFF